METLNQQKIQIHQFNNGLRLVYYFWNSPVAYTGVFIPAGSRHELEEEQGLAHFIEHTLFKGTKKRSSLSIINRLEVVGGELNAYTGREETVIHASFLAEYSRRTFELLSDILYNATFPDKELEKEKEVIIDEINDYIDSPDELIFDDFEENLFPNQPFGRNILGTPQKVYSFTSQSVQKFIKRNYSNNNMIISYVGKMPFDKARDLVEKFFVDNHQFDSQKKNITESPVPSVRFSKVITKKVQQAHCILGGIAPSSCHDDYWTMALLNNYLGGPSMNSILNLALRERHGYTYSNESNYSAYSDIGFFEIYLSSDVQTLPKCLRIIEQELKKLSNISDAMLKRIKEQMCGQIAIAADSGLTRMLSIGKTVQQTGAVMSDEAIFKKIRSISKDDFIRLSEQYLDFDCLNVLMYHPDNEN